VLARLDRAAGTDRDWWETDVYDLVTEVADAGTVMVVLTGIARMLRDGADVDVVVGDTTATAAFAVAREWLDAGIEATDVVGWLLAGCWKPAAARAMADAGLAPTQLLDDNGQPMHLLDVATADGQPLPLARAVAEEFVAVDSALTLAMASRDVP
jgi:hypothetical protein